MILSSVHKMWLIIAIGLLPVSSLMLYMDLNMSHPTHAWSFTILFYVGIAILSCSVFVFATTMVLASRQGRLES